MKLKAIGGIMLTLLLIGMLYTTLNVRLVTAWSNGGWSADPSNPDYGTHDWIAQHALDWLPTQDKRYILDNLAAYLYGTELPDNPDGIADTIKHHIYYWSNGSLQDDASAVRAREEYNNAFNFLRSGDLANASKTVGIMSHYIVDVAVFGHVMGGGTDWGPEQHHSDYESYVNLRTSSYDAEFNVYLSFDGNLAFISAYDAAKELAYDTTFDVDGDLTCVWMDQNYNWSDPVFKNRCGESLNLAVNYLADVLHTLYLEATLPVHNLDTGLNYSTIQNAINAPETLDGHTILVDAGTYYEHVTVDKSLTIIGENRSNTIIDGNGTGTVVYINASNVNISYFTIQNSGGILEQQDSGIFIEEYSEGNIVCNNIISNSGYGIYVYSGYNIVTNNTISNSYAGILLDFYDNNIVSGNILTNNIGGLILKFSGGNTLRNNSMTNNKWNFGVSGMYLSDYDNDIDTSNLVDGKSVHYLVNQSNLIINSSTFPDVGYLGIVNSKNMAVKDLSLTKNFQGVLFAFTSYSTIENVDASNNYIGIHFIGSAGNTVANNTISKNSIGIALELAGGNTLYHNNFINNEYQARAYESSNLWDNGYPSGGNYWSDYKGVDLYKGPYQNMTGSDEIGDTPYVIDNYNKDNYPLMRPMGIGLYVDPSLVEYWTPAYGKTFNVNIKIAYIASLYGFEFKLYWNTSLLDLISVNVTPPSVWGTNYFVGMNETREDLGRCWLAVTALSPAPPFSGSAKLVTLTFKITYDPVYPENVTSALNLEDSKLCDPDAQLIPHIAYDGKYWCYSTKPRLTVTPPEFRAKKLGIPLIINITISDIVNLYSFKFKLSYNTTILDATNIAIGPFIKKPYHVDKQIIDDAAGLVWLEVTSTSPAPSANGSGVLARITFEYFASVWPNPPLQCTLHLYDTLLKTNLGVVVQHDAVDGLYIYEPIPGDLNSDGSVNVLDLRIVARAFGSKPSDPNWDIRADLNRDGEVDICDLVILGRNYGRKN